MAHIFATDKMLCCVMQCSRKKESRKYGRYQSPLTPDFQSIVTSEAFMQDKTDADAAADAAVDDPVAADNATTNADLEVIIILMPML